MKGAKIETATMAQSKGVSCTALHVQDRQGRSRLPSATREIREIHRRGFLRDRLHAQTDDRAYGRRVIHVEVGRRALAKALDQPVVLDEVHAAVAGALRGGRD